MTTVAIGSRGYVLAGPAKDRPVVELWADRRLPFEPRGSLKEMRDELRGALEALPGESDRMLEAVYASTDTGFFDVENVLLYNVGTGAFGHLARRGLRFRRERRPVPPGPGGRIAAHYHRYALVDAPVASGQGTRLGSFRFELPSLTAGTKPHAVWWAMRDGDVVVEREGGYRGTFGLRVEVGLPVGRRVNLAALVKPLLDGVIAGLHAHVGEVDDVAARRLAKALGVDRARVVAELLSDRCAVLGGCELVAAYRDFVKWSPEDHRCELGEVVRVDGGARGVSISGEVFSVAAPEPVHEASSAPATQARTGTR